MIAVIFEVFPKPESKQTYLDIASELKPLLAEIDGFISIERFVSLQDENKALSLSFWENEAAIKQWRNLEKHRQGQAKGIDEVFNDYRIRVGHVVRDYTLENREQAPKDSNGYHHEKGSENNKKIIKNNE